ncbi:MAG: nucleotidyltransferase domain-containing protein [Epsilonproteobacteria bacterium]|nr:nucleotidyltransferase domain-containing protein [Campylobacterota bacterium]
MRADKNAIFHYLQELKPMFSDKNLALVGFFGSFARDEATPYSDIDIAIKKDAAYLQNRGAYDYFNDIASLKEMVMKKFHRNVDIFDIDSNSAFKEKILQEMIHV